MANKKSKYAGFISAANDKLADVYSKAQEAAANGSSPDETREQLMMQAALAGGNFGSSAATQNALSTYNQLMLEGAEVAKQAGFKPDSQDYDDFVNYFAYMMWPQDSPISYDDFYNANSKRLENIKAQELENQTKAEHKKVEDFSAAMQQYDPITGMPLGGDGRVADTFSGSANADNRLIGNAGAVSIPDDWFSGFRGRLQKDKEYGQKHPNEKWGSASEWFNYG